GHVSPSLVVSKISLNGAIARAARFQARPLSHLPEYQVHAPVFTESTECLGTKGHIMVDFLHVIAIVEHAQKSLEQRQLFRVECLCGLRKKSDFLNVQHKPWECLVQCRFSFVKFGWRGEDSYVAILAFDL